MPFITPLTYFFLLPSRATFLSLGYDGSNAPPASEYMPISAEPVAEDDEVVPPQKNVTLSLADKWCLVRPLLLKYMLPLCQSLR